MKNALSTTLSVALIFSSLAPAAIAQSNKSGTKKTAIADAKSSLLLPGHHTSASSKTSAIGVNDGPLNSVRAVSKSGKK